MPQDTPPWFQDVAAVVADLVQDKPVMRRFREIVRLWKTRQEKEGAAWQAWAKKRYDHFFQVVRLPKSHPWRVESKSPPEPGMEWMASEMPGLWAWAPKEVSPKHAPPQNLLVFSGDRPLRLEEKYTVLAAIHDSAIRWGEKIDPWPDPPPGASEEEKGKALGEGSLYASVVFGLFGSIAEGLSGREADVRRFLAEVKADLGTARFPALPLSPGPQRKAGRTMSEDRRTSFERASRIALAVDRLVAKPGNRQEFLSQIEGFKREAADWRQRKTQAEEVLEEATRSIAAEVDALKAGGGRTPLDGPPTAAGAGMGMAERVSARGRSAVGGSARMDTRRGRQGP